MLVLSRHRDQEIQIDDDVTIKVLEIRGDQVRIGIAAPDGVSVHRGEVYAKILRAGELSKSAVSAEVA